MALLARYRCDEQDNQNGSAVPLVDSGGHANNHDAPLTIFNTAADGFSHKRINCQGNVYSSGYPANEADFALAAEMTVMAWVHPQGIFNPISSFYEWVMGYGSTASATQPDNDLWGLFIGQRAASVGLSFGMHWEHGAGVDVFAWAPDGALADGFHGQKGPHHIAVIRSNGGADVKFVLDGVDLAADVLGQTVPDGGGNSHAWLFAAPTTSNTYRLNSAVADIRVYDSAESVATVQGIYNTELTRHRLDTRPGEVMTPMGRYVRGGEQGSIYVPADMGSELDPIERPNSGWAGVRP